MVLISSTWHGFFAWKQLRRLAHQRFREYQIPFLNVCCYWQSFEITWPLREWPCQMSPPQIWRSSYPLSLFIFRFNFRICRASFTFLHRWASSLSKILQGSVSILWTYLRHLLRWKLYLPLEFVGLIMAAKKNAFVFHVLFQILMTTNVIYYSKMDIINLFLYIFKIMLYLVL